MSNRKRRHDPAREVADFNARYPVGTMVKYWRGVVGDDEHGGVGATRTKAEVLSGHTAVIWIEGCSGCVALSHVVVLEAMPI